MYCHFYRYWIDVIFILRIILRIMHWHLWSYYRGTQFNTSIVDFFTKELVASTYTWQRAPCTQGSWLLYFNHKEFLYITALLYMAGLKLGQDHQPRWHTDLDSNLGHRIWPSLIKIVEYTESYILAWLIGSVL